MSFRTQRLANAFPLWSKIRRDESSFGHRLLDTFAEVTAEQTVTARKLADDPHLLKPYLGVGCLWSVYLDEDDVFQKADTAAGTFTYIYPDVVGTLDAVDYTLVRYEDLITLLNATPARIAQVDSQAYSSFTVWDSSTPYAYGSLPRPERLYIDVTDTTFFSRKSNVNDREYSGRNVIQVVGTDENDIAIREYVRIPDEGVYSTRNIYKTVTEVITEGFDGNVLIEWFPNAQSFEPDPYRTAIFDDFEGQLRLSLSTQVVGGPTYSYVEYSSPRLKLGEQYRRTGIELTSNVETLAEVVLLNSSGNPYTAVDLAINHQTSKMYVLDSQGNVHVYDHELSSFSVVDSTDTETDSTYIELVPLRHRAKFGDTEYLYTHFARLRQSINKIEIKRRDPAGNIEYLQLDKSTWGAAQAYIAAANPSAALPESSWQDFRFATEYNQLGQWEYTLTTVSTVDTTVYVTAVLVGSMTADVSLSTAVVSPTAVGFSKEGYLGVTQGSEVKYFEEFVDGWTADTRTDRILMRSNYDSLEVTY